MLILSAAELQIRQDEAGVVETHCVRLLPLGGGGVFISAIFNADFEDIP
jgi:hypothetical protein